MMKIKAVIAEKKVGNEIILYDREEGDFFLINGAEVIIWEMLKRRAFTKESAIEHIVDEYDVAEEELKRDIDVFLGEFKRYGIIED